MYLGSMTMRGPQGPWSGDVGRSRLEIFGREIGSPQRRLYSMTMNCITLTVKSQGKWKWKWVEDHYCLSGQGRRREQSAFRPPPLACASKCCAKAAKSAD